VSAVLIASTDSDRQVVILTVEAGALDDGHVDVMRSSLAVLPDEYGLVVDVTGVDALGAPIVQELRALARDASTDGRLLVFVCGDLLLRKELILADLDALAPVVEALEHAVPLVRPAA
jgi:anti-anti-sigma regulatory factor